MGDGRHGPVGSDQPAPRDRHIACRQYRPNPDLQCRQCHPAHPSARGADEACAACGSPDSPSAASGGARASPGIAPLPDLTRRHTEPSCACWPAPCSGRIRRPAGPIERGAAHHVSGSPLRRVPPGANLVCLNIHRAAGNADNRLTDRPSDRDRRQGAIHIPQFPHRPIVIIAVARDSAQKAIRAQPVRQAEFHDRDPWIAFLNTRHGCYIYVQARHGEGVRHAVPIVNRQDHVVPRRNLQRRRREGIVIFSVRPQLE